MEQRFRSSELYALGLGRATVRTRSTAATSDFDSSIPRLAQLSIFYREFHAFHRFRATFRAKVYALITAITNADRTVVVEALEAADKLNLVEYWVYHPYDRNPDTSYASVEK